MYGQRGLQGEPGDPSIIAHLDPTSTTDKDVSAVTKETVGTSSTTPLLLRAEDVARELQIGRTKAFELMGSGAIPSVFIGRLRRVRREDLIAYIEDLPTDP